MSSRTTPYDVQRVPSYPDALQIYRIPASRFWQMRLFVDGRYVRKSTRTDEKRQAIEKAKEFYDTVRLHQRADIAVHSHSFRASADHLMRRQASLVATEQRDQRIVTEDRRKLGKDILPFFGNTDVAAITTSMLDDYVARIGERGLSPSTISKHLIVIRKVLKEAQRHGFLKAIPIFPTVRRRDTARPYFTDRVSPALAGSDEAREAGAQGARGALGRRDARFHRVRGKRVRPTERPEAAASPRR